MKRRPRYPTSLIAFSLAFGVAAVALARAGRFAVQIEASPARAEAEASVDHLKTRGVAAYVVESLVPGKGVYFRVRAGDFADRAAAERYGRQLKSQGTIRDFFIAAYEAPEPATPADLAPAPIDPSPPASKQASVPPGYARYRDADAGYSFEYPQSWVGGQLSANEAVAQRVTAGARFKSNEDPAFLNAIWNEFDDANDSDHDNDMLVDLILESMASGNGTQDMQAVSRRVIQDGPQIKTFLDLKTAFQVPNRPVPLEYLGKAVIIRASKGILLLVAFYSRDAPQTVAIDADHIVQTAMTPE